MKLSEVTRQEDTEFHDWGDLKLQDFVGGANWISLLKHPDTLNVTWRIGRCPLLNKRHAVALIVRVGVAQTLVPGTIRVTAPDDENDSIHDRIVDIAEQMSDELAKIPLPEGTKALTAEMINLLKRVYLLHIEDLE